jgi:hypothetical protein
MRYALGAILLFIALSTSSSAQTFRGSISEVTDQTGAIVPGVALRATNQATALGIYDYSVDRR